MIAKAKVISHGSNAIRYSVDKDKAEIVKTNLLPDDISPTAMWARMLALQFLIIWLLSFTEYHCVNISNSNSLFTHCLRSYTKKAVTIIVTASLLMWTR